MKFRLQLVTVSDSGREQVFDTAQLEVEGATMETPGLSLAEGKPMLKQVQEAMVREQVNDALLRLRCCPVCGKAPTRSGRDLRASTAGRCWLAYV
jgi:hypothetical protein